MKRKYFYVFGLVFSLLLASCNIGLGEAIDTESPKIDITSPNEGAIIRDKFAIKGTYSDDGQIKSIVLNLNNLVTGDSKTYDAIYSENAYSFTIDPLNEGIKDGNYLANVTITDTYGHVTHVSSPYTIDNTAPVIILSRPESKKGSESFEMFGQEFKLEGRAHDDNEIEIEVQVFSKDDEEKPLLTKTLKNVNRSIELTVLDAKNALEDYEKVYGKISTEENETKNLYCKIIAKDSSKRYPVSEEDISPTDNEGNKIETYYLESEFEEVIRASYSATDLYKMINGTFDASGRQVDESIKIEDIQKLLENNKVPYGQFSLNPANNPSYEVTNFNAPLNKDGKDFEGEDYKLTRGSSITVKVNSGLDGTYILGKSLGVYVSECDDEGKILDKENKIWLIEPEIDEDGNTRELTEEQIASRKAALETQLSVEKSKSYTFKSIELKASRSGMMLGKKYLIFVSGYDTNKTKVSNFNKDYGFYFAPKDAAPTLTVTEPSANTTYLAKSATLKVSGTSKTEMGIPVIEICVNGVGVKTLQNRNDFASVIEDEVDLSNTSTFEYEIPASAFDQKTSNEYLVSIVAKLEGKETVKEKTVSYDVDSPEILIQSVTPGIEKENVEYLNKTSLIKGSINDSFTGLQTNTLKYSVWQDDEEKLSGVIPTPSNFTVKIDTEKLIDEKEMILKLYAEDKAGNVKEITETYFVDQDTDIPNISSNDESWDAQIDSEEKLNASIGSGENKNVYITKGVILFDCTDDDGIKSVQVNETPAKSYNGSPLSVQHSHTLPDRSGRYALDIKVTDINNVVKTQTIWVLVTGAAPDVKTTVTPEYFSILDDKKENAPKVITVSGTNEGAGPFTIEVISDNANYSTVKFEGDETWTHSFVPTNADVNQIVYKITDAWGLYKEEKVSFKQDNIKPSVTITAVPTTTDTQEQASFKYKGTASDDGSDVEKIEVSFDGTNWVEASGTTSWTLISIFNDGSEDAYKTEGPKTIYVRAYDNAGNYSNVVTKDFVFDKAEPVVAIQKYDNNEISTTQISVQDEFTLSGSATDAYGIESVTLEQTKDKTSREVPVTFKNGIWTTENLPVRDANAEIESGTYVYTVKATDKAGKVSSSTLSVLIDKEGPKVEIVTPDASYLGTAAIDKVTFTFAGRAIEEIGQSGVASYSYAIVGQGKDASNWIEVPSTAENWSFTKNIPTGEDPLAEGKYTLYVKAKDKAGNESSVVSRNFDVDLAAPSVEVSLSSGTRATTEYFDSSFNLVGTIADSNGIASVVVKINGEKTPIVKETPNSTSYSLNKEITVNETDGTIKTDGTYNFEVTVTDKVGKTTTKTLSAIVDTKAPTVEFKSHANGNIVTTVPFEIEGTVTDAGSGISTEGGTFVLKQGETVIQSGTLTVQPNGMWTQEIGKNDTGLLMTTEGDYTIQVSLNDNAGKTSTQTVNVVYDKALPQLSVTSGNSVITNGNVVISGKSWDTYGLKENGSVVITLKDADANIVRSFTPEVAKTTSEPTDNNWEETIEVGEGKSIETDGKYTVEIKAIDKVGKESVIKTINVDVDTTKPIVGSSIIVPTSTQTEGTSFKFNGISSDGEGTGVEKVEISFDEETWVEAVGTSVWTYTSIFSEEKTFETDGAKTIYVRATDGAGNESEVRSGMFVFDSSRPEGKIKNEEGVEITGKSFFVGGEFTLNVDAKDKYSVSKIELTQTKDGEDLKTYTQEVEGKEVTTAISRLPLRTDGTEIETGNYEYKVVVTDKVGKTAEITTTIVIDKRAPKVEITSPDSSYVGISAIAKDVFTFAGTAEEESYESGVESYSYVLTQTDGIPTTGWTTTTSGTNWSFTKEIGNDAGKLSEGSWTLYVKARDKAGNETAEADYAKVSFDVDKGNPVANISLNPISETNTYKETFKVEGKLYDTNGVSKVKVSILNAKDNSEVVSWEKDGIEAKSQPTNNNLSEEITIGTNGKITSDGNYIIEVTVTDNVGKEVTERRSITVDRKGPTVEFKSHEDGNIITTFPITVEGTASDEGSGVNTEEGVFKLIQGSTTVESGKLNIQANGIWNGSIVGKNLTEGEYKLQVTIKDKAGYDDTSAVTVEYDKALPQLIVTEPSGNSVITNENVVISGKSWDTYGLKENGSVVITLKDANANIVRSFTPEVAKTTSEPTDNNWEETIEVGEGKSIKTDGKYTVEIKAVDKVGKESLSQVYELTIDRVNPEINTSIVDETKVNDSNKGSDGTDTVYNVTQIPIKVVANDEGGSGLALVSYSVTPTVENSYNALVLKNGEWTGYVTCDWQGTQNISVKAEDNAGNSLTKTIPVTIDTIAPDTITSSIEGTRLENGTRDVQVEISATDAGNSEGTEPYNSGISKVEIVKIGSQKVTGSGTWDDANKKWILKILSGEISTGGVTVKVTDNANNSVENTIFTFQLDNKKPTVSITGLSDADSSTEGTQINGTVTLTGTSNDDQGLAETTPVKLYYSKDGGTTYTSMPAVTGTTSWSLDIATTTAFGSITDGTTITLKAEAVDKAGNTNETTTTVIVNQDTDRPIINLSNLDISEMTSVKGIFYKQKVLYGSITDDDGTVQSVKISLDGTTWTDNIYNNGTWDYSFAEDGTTTVYFEITDKSGNTFASNGTLKPKLSDGQNKNTEDANLYLRIDTTSPTIPNVWFRTTKPTSVSLEKVPEGASDDEKAEIEAKNAENAEIIKAELETQLQNPIANGWIVGDSLSTTVIGGPESKLYVMYVANDANGIYKTIAKLNSTYEGTQLYESATKESRVVEFSLTGIPSGNNKLEIKAHDNASGESDVGSQTRTFDLNVDNTPPEVSFGSLQNIYYGSESNSISGTMRDTNTINELYLGLSKDDTEEPEPSEYLSVDYENRGQNTWTVTFDGGVTNSESTSLHTEVLNKWLDSLYGEGTQNNDAVKDVWLWAYAVDEMGNTSEVEKKQIKVSPQGDKPSVTIEVPAEGDSTGGSVRISGVANIQTSNIDSVWVQIDPSYDTSTGFDNNWKSELETIITGKAVPYSIEENPQYEDESGNKKSISGINGNAAIKANGTSSWNLIINGLKEFQTDGENKLVAVRVYAVSKTGKVSEKDEVSFTIDPKSPRIGNTTPLQLVQYEADGTIKASMNYESGMWIKGNWFLIGSVEDESGISQIYYGDNKGEPVSIMGTDKVNEGDPSKGEVIEVTDAAASGAKNYMLKIPVGNNTENDFGRLEYYLSVVEGGTDGKDASQTIILNYDNQAPQFTAELDKIGNEIYQSDGTYSIKGTFDETSSGVNNQSGFNRIAMFFERSYTKNGVTTKYLVDPMLEGGDSGTANRYPISEFENKNNLYWRTAEADITNEGIVFDSLPTNVRVGGLCMIKDVIYRIQTVRGNVITIDKPIVNQNDVTVYFALAQVIDNTTVESGLTKAYEAGSEDKEDDDHINGDGDQMIEGVQSTGGTEQKWSVGIDSSLIYDGPITIRFVAFDAAGNMTCDDFSGNVSNNAPRIAGVSFGTDNNGDGTISDENEMITAYSGWYDIESPNKQTGVTQNGKKANGQNVSVFNVGYNEYDDKWETSLVVKGDIKVIPEIVGGNTGLGYSVMQGNTSVIEYADYEGVGHSADGSVREENLSINVTVKDFLLKQISDGEKQFSFKIWDKTEGTTAGVNSQHADINIQMNVMLQDIEAPTVSLIPFYWKGKTENSLYQNSRENGHIELEGDLNGNFNTNSGLYDKDPKVSGKITIEGTASDNVLLMELGVKTEYKFNVNVEDNTSEFDDESYEPIAKRVEGVWTSLGTLDANGWQFEAVEEKNTQTEGNTLKWKLHLDTQKVENVAQTDFILYVQAKDRGRAYLDGDENLKYAYDAPTNDYKPKTAETTRKMDIVPYITGVQTWLVNELKTSIRDAYSRTALGHYIINENEGNIPLTGFNLDGNTTIASSAATTGAYSVTVNGVESLNNKNNNNAKGSYTKTMQESCSYEDKDNFAYNRLANGRTNNLLTDDIYFDVWEFDSDAAIPESGKLSEPVMKINPVTGKVGFAFVSGPAHFSMGAGTGNSYETYQRNYATFSNISFAYDDNGNSYGTATGLDTYPDGATNTLAGRFTFMTNRWGKDIDSMDDNYNFENKIRFEAIGLPGANNCYVKGEYPKSYTMTETRFYSPSMAVTTHSNEGTVSATVYLAYYDDVQDQIRFRYGTVGNGRGDFNNFVDNEGLGSNTKDSNGNWNNSRKYVFESDTANFSLIAGADWQNYANRENANTGLTKKVGNNYFYDTGYEADAYVAIDAIKTDAGDIVVAVWYDGKDCYYAYNTDPDSGLDNGKAGGWTTKKIFSGGGEYCTIKVDSNKGIHIAANVDGALKYAYLSSYNASYTEATQAIKIDSCAITGEQITIDVGKKTIGSITYEIPYISYYMSASKKPCIAYITENAISDSTMKMNYAAAGTDKNDCFTGNWEVSVIPAQSQLSGGHSDKINVGLWKDTSGTIINSYYKPADGTVQNIPNNESATGSGNCYGNGTANPIFGYAIKSTSGTCIETAQMK